MATQGKKGGKNKTKDPLNKWTDSPDEIRRKIEDPVVAASIEVNKLQSALMHPGLSRTDRLALQRALAEARAVQRQAKESATVTRREVAQTQRFQKDLVLKLSSLQAYMADSQNNLNPEMRTKLHILQGRLNTLLIKSAEMHTMSEEEMGAMMVRLDRLQKTQEALPTELRNEFKSQTEILEVIAKRQEAADAQLQKVKDDIRGLGRKVGSWAARKSMDFADRVGIGALNAGNVIRGAGMAYKGGKAVYGAGAYAAKSLNALRISMGAKGAAKATENSTEEELLATFKEHVASSKRFQRRALIDGAKSKVNDMSGLFKALVPDWLKKMPAFMSGAGALGVLGKAGGVGAAAGVAAYGLKKLYDAGKELIGAHNREGVTLTPDAEKRIREGALGSAEAQKLQDNKPGDSILSKKTWVNSGDKIKDLFSGKTSWFGDTKTDTSQMPIVQGFNSLKESTSSALTNVAAASSSLVNKGSMLVSDWLGKTFSAGGGVDVAGLNPNMQANMTAMAQEYYQATGKKLPLNSAHRSNEKQAQLYKSMPKGMAAPPGSSLHNYGLAFDTNSATGNELDRLGLLQKYGFERPIAKEKWHVQPKGMSLSAAKSGLYSADAPANQQMASAKTRPVPQTITAPSISSPSSASNAGAGGAGGGGGGKDAIAATGRNGVKDIPTFESSDGLFLAMNVMAI